MAGIILSNCEIFPGGKLIWISLLPLLIPSWFPLLLLMPLIQLPILSLTQTTSILSWLIAEVSEPDFKLCRSTDFAEKQWFCENFNVATTMQGIADSDSKCCHHRTSEMWRLVHHWGHSTWKYETSVPELKTNLQLVNVNNQGVHYLDRRKPGNTYLT